MQHTRPPRAETSRASSILALILMTIVVLFVAGVAAITLLWLAKTMLGG